VSAYAGHWRDDAKEVREMLRPRTLLISLSAVLGLGLAPISAGAFTIGASDLTSNQSSVDLGFATVSAAPGVFAHKSVAGYDVVGVAGGYEGGEIDLASEAIDFHFATAQTMNELSLGLLFAAGEHDDAYNEQALVRVSFADGSSADYVLAVVDATTATWSGSGSVTTLSPATFGNAGVFSISNPFGTAAVNGITLLPIGPALPANMRNNDYGFVGLSTTPVPEPGTLVLMGMGLAGLAMSGRKRGNA
jgi:hypothetical protein